MLKNLIINDINNELIEEAKPISNHGSIKRRIHASV